MRLIIGLIIFWMTIFGIKFLLEDKFKVDDKFSFALSFTVIGIVEFILGILNLMKLGSLLMIILSISYIGFKIIKKGLDRDKIFEYIKKPTNIICFMIFIYITIVGLRMHITHYDNFSHWGLIVKIMFEFNRLPNFENDYVFFKGYQPGSACFIYFFGLVCGKKEEIMIIAHNYLIFSYLTVLFNYIGKNKKILKSLLLICFYIFIMTTSKIRFNNLLVDSLLAVQFIYGIAIIYNYKNNIKKASIYSVPIAIYLLMVKNTGLVLSGLMCLYILYLSYKQKELKMGIKYVIIIALFLLLTLLLWQSHVSLVYGHWALSSKHSLSLQNLYLSVKKLGIDNIKLFVSMYTKHLFSLKTNLTNIYLLIFNIVSLILLFLSRSKKNILKFILLLDAIYLGYYIILGMMYIFSMPWEEAKIFASYDRYMMMIIVIIIGLFILYLFNNSKKINNQLIYLIMISAVLLIPVYFEYYNFAGLIGKDDYKGSKVEQFDKIKNQISRDKDLYYIYAPSAEGDNSYLYFIAVYELQKKNIYILHNPDDINYIKGDSYIILFDELDNYDELFDERFVRINDHVLSK